MPEPPHTTGGLVDRLARSASHANVALVSATVGVIVLAASLYFARDVLTVHDPPIGTRSIALRGPVDDVARRGLVLVSHIEASTCDEPVVVTVTVEGTAEYWRANAHRMRGDAGDFTVTVDDPLVADVSAGVGVLGDNLNPGLLPLSSHDAATRLRAQDLQVRRKRQTTLITGRIPHWRRSWAPVYASFRANWLRPRAAGSCYLALSRARGGSHARRHRGQCDAARL
ncbi:MAG: hypothetical protein ACJ76L_05255 [Conexibacter sp.]